MSKRPGYSYELTSGQTLKFKLIVRLEGKIIDVIESDDYERLLDILQGYEGGLNS